MPGLFWKRKTKHKQEKCDKRRSRARKRRAKNHGKMSSTTRPPARRGARSRAPKVDIFVRTTGPPARRRTRNYIKGEFLTSPTAQRAFTRERKTKGISLSNVIQLIFYFILFKMEEERRESCFVCHFLRRVYLEKGGRRIDRTAADPQAHTAPVNGGNM